ncbi:MAG: hypothetical protein IT459_08830 [Planctomycetes bacterium]|nr:hypothetical protein [Planctomycetota bacterium]
MVLLTNVAGELREGALDHPLVIRVEAPDGTPVRGVEFDLAPDDVLSTLLDLDPGPRFVLDLSRVSAPHAGVPRLAFPYPLPAPPGAGTARLPSASRLTTDENGIVRVSARTPRTIRIPDALEFVLPRNGAPWWIHSVPLPVAGDVGTEEQPLTIRLAVEAGVMAGRVVDDRGAPIAFSWVTVDATSRSTGCFDESRIAHGCTGSFRIACSRAPSTVRFTSPGHATRSVTAVPSPEPITIVMDRAARLETRIAIPDGVAPEWFALRMTRVDDASERAVESIVHSPSHRVDVAMRGDVRVDLVSRATRATLASQRTRLEPGAIVPLAFELSAIEWATIQFSIDGEMPALVGVRAGFGVRATADATGIVRVPCPPDGIDVVVCGFGIADQRVRVQPGRTTVALTRVR